MKYIKFAGCLLGIVVTILAFVIFVYTFQPVMDFWLDQYYALDEAWWVQLAPSFQFLFGVASPGYLFYHFWKKLPGLFLDLRRTAPEKA